MKEKKMGIRDLPSTHLANEQMRENIAQVFFFLLDLLPDAVSKGVDGLDSTFCTSSIPRF